MSFQQHNSNVQSTTRGSVTSSKFGGSGGGDKYALCIGIDEYPKPSDRLFACVRDARAWKKELESRGFDVNLLTNSAATRRGIVKAISGVIAKAKPGDVVAIQLSCHGTQVFDFSNDETDTLDEAIVPYDHRDNGYIIDDEIGRLCGKIREGVNVSFFMDLCHSGSATRMFLGGPEPDQDYTVRFLFPDAQMLESHKKNSTSKGNASRARSVSRREVLFAACEPNQTAKERAGHGDFTRYALKVMGQDSDSLTNAAFLDTVKRIGRFSDQTPGLWADTSLHSAEFLAPVSPSRSSTTESCHGKKGRKKAAMKAAISDIESALQHLKKTL